MDNELFPKMKKGIEDFIQDEEGNISRSKVAMIGSMMVVLAVMLSDTDIFAAHRSHSSHSSHRSGSSGYHSSHVSHRSHSSGSHSSHSSGSHSSHASGSHSAAAASSGSHSSSGSATSGGTDSFSLPDMQKPLATPTMK